MLIFQRYARGFLVIDVLSTIPLDLCVSFTIQLMDGSSASGTTGVGNSNRLLKTLRLVRLVKLLRIVKVTPFLLFPPSAP